MQQLPIPARIAFVGPAGSGKTTWANDLIATRGFQRERFAATVYDGVAKIFDVTEADILANKSFWRPVMQAFGTAVVRNPEAKEWDAAEILARLLRDVDPQAADTLYSDANLTRVRHYFATHPYGVPDAFVQLTRQRIETNFQALDCLALDDCRFVNEAVALRELGFTLVRLNVTQDKCLERMVARDGQADPKLFEDPSERQWHLCEVDVEVDANGPVDQVRRSLYQLLAYAEMAKGLKFV